MPGLDATEIQAMIDTLLGADSGWRLALNDNKQELGAVHWGKREIRISRHALRLNEPDGIRELVLHEVAHVLRGRTLKHHDARWKQIAVELGCTGRRQPQIVTPPHEYTLACWGCGVGWFRHRVTRRMPRCPRCRRRMRLLRRATQ